MQGPSDPFYNASENISKARERLDDPIQGTLEDEDYIICQDGIFQGAKAIAKLVQESLG